MLRDAGLTPAVWWLPVRDGGDIVVEPVAAEALDADELARLQRARENGWNDHFVSPERVKEFAGQDPKAIAGRLVNHFFAGQSVPDYRRELLRFLQKERSGTEAQRTEAVVLALLKSPAYQFC